MPKLKRRSHLPAVAGLLLLLPLAAEAAMYRWVDEQGNVHFSDKIPAEQALQDTRKEEIDPRGFTRDVVQEKQKTPEQLAEEERVRKLEEAEQQRIDAERQHDRLLIGSYDSVDALELARDGKINALESQILVANGQIKEREDLLARQQASAAALERSGKPLNKKLQEDIATTERQIERNRDHIAKLRADQERIRAEYASDIARYKELKGLK